MRPACAAALSGAIVLVFSCAVLAVDNLWLGGTTDWNTPANWSLGRVPALNNGATEGDTFDDAVINTTEPQIATINASLAVTPRDIVVGSGMETAGVVNHLAGTAATGPGNWMFVGRHGGYGTYNLADTATMGAGITGFGRGSGSLNANGRLYVGGWGGAGDGEFHVNTTGTLAIAYQLQVGNGTGTGLFNLESGTVTTGTEWVEFGNGAGSRGTLNMTGGSFTKGGGNHFSIGTNGGIGVADISGGSLTVNNEIWLGQAGGSFGTLYFSGGSITNNSYVAVGRDGGTGIVDMTGGTWTKTGGGAFIIGASGPGTMTQSGGLVEVLAGDTWMGESGPCSFTLSDTGEFRASFFQVARNASSTATVNLAGGTLRVARIGGGNGTEYVYFDGTRVIATSSQSAFISGIDAGRAVISIGGLDLDSNGFNLGVPQALTGMGAVVKSGAGTLTLSGANTYEGGNFVTAGKLAITTATTVSGDCAVDDGAALGVIQTAPDLSLVVPNATFGQTGATTLDFDLGNTPGNPTAPPLAVTDTLVLKGPVTVNITDAFPATGTLPLIFYPAPKFGTGQFQLGKLPDGTTGTLHDNGAGLVTLTLDKVVLLKWNGSGGSRAPWDFATTNWTDRLTGQPTAYSDPGSVLFDDDAAAVRVDLNTTVAPAAVVIDNPLKSYRFEGTGKITGPGSFLKRGGGALTQFLAANDYTGATRLEGGTTTLRDLANSGSPSAIGASSASPANLVLASAVVNYTGPAIAIDRGFTISGANSGLTTTNDLTLGGPVVCVAGNLTKSGAGKLTLTHPGANAFGTVSPAVRVNQGTLALAGSGTQTNSAAGDCWIGASPNLAAHFTLAATSLHVSGWLGIGRGNGNTGVTSSLTAVDSQLRSGNFSAGYIGTETLNNAAQTISLSNSVWTNDGVAYFAESTGSATTMTVAGNSEFTTAGALRMAMAAGTTVNLTIQDTARVTKTGGWLSIGDGGAGVATATVKHNASLASTAGDFNIGDTGTSQGTLHLGDSATVSSTGIAYIGKGSGTKGTLNQTGGSFTGHSWISIGRFTGGSGNAIGVANISGGLFAHDNPDTRLIVGEGGTGTLTLSGSGGVVSTGGVLIAGDASGIGTVHLNGGSLTTTQVAGGSGASAFHFNGGTLVAGTGAAADFMTLVDAVTVGEGGAVIDTNGRDIAIHQDLEDGGGGLDNPGAGTLALNAHHS